MLPPGGRVLCAVSGGADSVALLHLLLELQERGELVVAGVAHFNHSLRGVEADADEEFCRQMAASVNVPFEGGRGNVMERARAEKRSLEDAGRASRYEFLERVATHLAADGIAVGHTRDDQAETFLLRVIRGAGTRGLGGIRPRAGRVIRPLIDVRRQALRDYVAAKRLTHREDSTNRDVGIPRNRVRHELIPYLEREFSPGIVEVLAREAASAQQDEERLTEEAIKLLPSVVLVSTPDASTQPSADEPIRIDAEALSGLHPAVAARVVREALKTLAGDHFVGFDHVSRLLDLARSGHAGSALSLPGQQARLAVIRPKTGRSARVIELGQEPPRAARRAVTGAVSPAMGSKKKEEKAGPSRGTGSASAGGR
jgi:tRNA(Ile)-lysidine synthase